MRVIKCDKCGKEITTSYVLCVEAVDKVGNIDETKEEECGTAMELFQDDEHNVYDICFDCCIQLMSKVRKMITGEDAEPAKETEDKPAEEVELIMPEVFKEEAPDQEEIIENKILKNINSAAEKYGKIHALLKAGWSWDDITIEFCGRMEEKMKKSLYNGFSQFKKKHPEIAERWE